MLEACFGLQASFVAGLMPRLTIRGQPVYDVGFARAKVFSQKELKQRTRVAAGPFEIARPQ
jgi:hypothetical protein